MQGIEKRAKIGIDLGLKVAGQETEPFAGFNRGTGEDDFLGLAVLDMLAAAATAR